MPPIAELHGSHGTKRMSDAIAETLIGEIHRNDLAVDEALPTERALCDRFSASRPTVREALAVIRKERPAALVDLPLPSGAGR